VKRVKVQICACNKCIMMGAMDIMENIESLKKLKNQLRMQQRTQAQVDLTMDKKICGELGDDVAPVVMINDEVITKASPEIVMEKILKLTQRK
jgi:NADH:ubiquinone oxidoreductase subunit E